MDRLLQLLFGDVLDVLIDRQNYVVAGVRLGCDVREPLLACIHGDEHLAGLTPEFIIECMLNAALAGVLHADRAEHLRSEISRWIKAFWFFLEVDALQLEGVDALDSFIVSFAGDPTEGLVRTAIGEDDVGVFTRNAGDQGNGCRQVFDFCRDGERRVDHD